MHNKSDAQLLGEYAAQHSDPAFAEIVARHTDLVYSAALRQTGSPELAREIAQSVFTDLARKARALAGTLSADASLAGWLFRGTRFAGLKWLRDDHRRKTRERQFMEHFNFNPVSETAPDWERVAPVLDEAMAELDDAGHEAVLLRYFKNQDFHAVGLALGVSDDTAQKRVSRAVERLREFLAKRGVTTGASGLVVLISANGVLTAPAGLSAAITAPALAGTAILTTASATAGKAIAMTTTQKAVVAVALTVAIGTGIYEARQASTARAEVQSFKQKQALLAEQLEQITRERDRATRQLAIFRDDYERLNLNITELARLRNEVGRLRGQITSNDSRDGAKTVRADAISALIELYERTPAQIDRCAIAIAFGEIGPAAKKAAPSLLRALDDPNLNVRRTAARALGGIHPEPDSVVPALIKYLNDQNPFVKQDVAYALADFGADAKEAIPTLIELLQDRDKGVRRDAEKALRRIDAEAASKALNDLGPAIEQLDRADAEAASKVEVK